MGVRTLRPMREDEDVASCAPRPLRCDAELLTRCCGPAEAPLDRLPAAHQAAVMPLRRTTLVLCIACSDVAEVTKRQQADHQAHSARGSTCTAAQAGCKARFERACSL